MGYIPHKAYFSASCLEVFFCISLSSLSCSKRSLSFFIFRIPPIDFSCGMKTAHPVFIVFAIAAGWQRKRGALAPKLVLPAIFGVTVAADKIGAVAADKRDIIYAFNAHNFFCLPFINYV